MLIHISFQQEFPRRPKLLYTNEKPVCTLIHFNWFYTIFSNTFRLNLFTPYHMKHFLSLLLFSVVFSFFVTAQEFTRSEEYCSVEVECVFQKGATRTYGALVDYGQPILRQGINSTIRGRRLTDEYGERMRFNSAIDILNYMNADGWELVEVIVKSDTDREFIMKRKVRPGSRLAADG